jgi:hypothetical protein
MEEGLKAFLNSILVTKSRLRCNVRFSVYEVNNLKETGHFDELLKRDIFNGLLKEYLKNNNFSIKKEDSFENAI